MTEQSNFDDINRVLDEALEMCGGSQNAAKMGIKGCDTFNGALGEYMLQIDAADEHKIDVYDQSAAMLSGVSGAWATSATIYEMLEEVTEGSGRANNVLEPTETLRRKAMDLGIQINQDHEHHSVAISDALKGVIAAIKAYVATNDERRLEFEDFNVQAQIVSEAIRQYKAGN